MVDCHHAESIVNFGSASVDNVFFGDNLLCHPVKNVIFIYCLPSHFWWYKSPFDITYLGLSKLVVPIVIRLVIEKWYKLYKGWQWRGHFYGSHRYMYVVCFGHLILSICNQSLLMIVVLGFKNTRVNKTLCPRSQQVERPRMLFLAQRSTPRSMILVF